MNIVNKTLLQNKKKTFLTFVCVFSSLLLFMTIMIGGESLRQSYIQTLDSYHYAFMNIDSKQLEIIKNDSSIKEYYIKSEPLHYALSDMSEDFTIQQYDEHAFLKENIFQDREGRLPQNPYEIIIHKNSQYQIGDDIQCLDNGKEIKYKVVGIINQVSYTEVQGYSLLKDNKYMNVYITDNKLDDSLFLHYDVLSDQLKTDQGYIHYELLAMNFVFGQDAAINQQVESYILFFIVIVVMVMLISMMIIHFAFSISNSVRIAYFGLLSSIGATPKQKQLSIFYEGIVISIFALPLAFLCSHFLLKQLFQYLNQLSVFTQNHFSLKIYDSTLMIIFIILLLIITLVLSLFPLSKKLVNIPIIELIKNTDDIQVSKKDILIKDSLKKHCSFEMLMAIKNHKRTKKNNRFIIISMVLSLTFITYIYILTTQQINNLEDFKKSLQYDLRIDLSKENEKEALEIVENHKKYINDSFYIQSCDMNMTLDQDCFIDSIHSTELLNVWLSVVDNDYFKRLCKENNIEYTGDKQALVSNGYSLYFKQSHIIKTLEPQNIKSMSQDIVKDDGRIEKHSLPLFDSIDIIDVNNHQLKQFGVIVSQDYLQYTQQVPIRTLYLDVIDDAHMKSQFQNFRIHSDREENENQIQIFTFIQKTISVFILLIVVFAITNSFNLLLIHASRRKKEFMIFKSLGMTSKQLLKMIVYENIIYAFKLMFYGIPISSLISYAGIVVSKLYFTDIHFFIPINLYIGYIIIVVMMMSVLTIVLYRILKNQNMIEIIKQNI